MHLRIWCLSFKFCHWSGAFMHYICCMLLLALMDMHIIKVQQYTNKWLKYGKGMIIQSFWFHNSQQWQGVYLILHSKKLCKQNNCTIKQELCKQNKEPNPPAIFRFSNIFSIWLHHPEIVYVVYIENIHNFKHPAKRSLWIYLWI